MVSWREKPQSLEQMETNLSFNTNMEKDLDWLLTIGKHFTAFFTIAQDGDKNKLFAHACAKREREKNKNKLLDSVTGEKLYKHCPL